MEIKRDKYLNELIKSKDSNQVKVITGLRRSGKSFLLFKLYKNYLLESGINNDQIITFSFDDDEDVEKLDSYFKEESTKIYISKNNYVINSKKFRHFINDLTEKEQKYYLLLDEIQLLENFVGTLNSFIRKEKFDTYVTGSNSKMLSSDIITEFRGRGENIHIYPLSFKEYFEVANKTFEEAYKEYSYFGGMPLLLSLEADSKKENYLKQLFEETYFKDIIDRNKIENDEQFKTLIKFLASDIGSYTNTLTLENTFISKTKLTYHHDTIKKHIDFAKDAFLINEAKRYDIKGKYYIGANSKYYFTDIGLRNALINFSQQEPTHIMENVIYNELIIKGYNVDVGIVEVNEKNENGNYQRKQLETDFICNNINKRIYIQSAYKMEDKDKYIKETKSLLNIKDNFRKIVIVNDNIKSYIDENGIEIVSLKDFLLEDNIL